MPPPSLRDKLSLAEICMHFVAEKDTTIVNGRGRSSVRSLMGLSITLWTLSQTKDVTFATYQRYGFLDVHHTLAHGFNSWAQDCL